MAQVVLLSDTILYGELGSTRYIAPYTLASQLEVAGFSTIVIDYFTQVDNFFEFIGLFLGSETLLVGISSTFLNPQVSYFDQSRDGRAMPKSTSLWFKTEPEFIAWTTQLKDLLKRTAPKAKLVLGGTKAVDFCFSPSAGKNIDFFILGAADRSLIRLSEAVRDNKPIETADFNGLRFLNEIGLKNQFDICPTANYKKEWAIQKKESLPIEVSRGCIFNCKFCYYEKKKSIRKPTAILIDELKRNYDWFGTTVYHFTDDCFNDSREKVETLCNEFLKLPFKIEWISYARVDVAVKFPETSDLMVASGASALFWGLESFDQETARRAGKGTPIDQVKDFLIRFMNSHSKSCFSFGSFIVGLPGESIESIYKTLDWLVQNKALHSVYFAALGLGVFNKNFDQVIVDYADYSRFPEKYGFTEVNSTATYWKHQQMDSIRATEVAKDLNQRWLKAKGNGLLSYIWQYPHFRTLGYSKEQLFNLFFDNSKKFDLAEEVAVKNKVFLNKYWTELSSNFTKENGR